MTERERKREYQRQYRHTPKGRQMRLANEARFRERHRERRNLENKKFVLKFLYGLTQEQYDVKLAAQDNRCAICLRHKDEFKRRLAVDHNHITGLIRGLLCLTCNSQVLPLVENNPSTLVNASKYLDNWNKNNGK